MLEIQYDTLSKNVASSSLRDMSVEISENTIVMLKPGVSKKPLDCDHVPHLKIFLYVTKIQCILKLDE